MSVVLEAGSIPPQDREEVIRDAIWQGVLPVEIDWHQPPEAIDVVCRLAVAGPLNFSSARSSTNSLRRTPSLARREHEERVFLAIQVAGTTRLEQDGRQVRLQRGEMVVYDSRRPYTLHNTGTTELHYFQVPRTALALPDPALAAVVGRRIAPDTNPLAAVVSSFLASLGGSDLLARPDAADLVAEPSIGLVRALVLAHGDGTLREDRAVDDALVLRVRHYVREHLRERDLTPVRIAREQHVSLRHLYATLERAGIGLRDSIQRQRLEECRRDLRDPASAHLAVSSVGSRWGFVDPSHFGRVFRATYGQTPNEWRRAGRPGEGPTSAAAAP